MPKIKKKSARSAKHTQEEIKSIAHNVADVYRAHRQAANTVITLVVLFFAVWFVYSAIQSGNERKAGLLFDSAYEAYSPSGGAPANYPLALQKFQEIAKEYGGTVNGAIARYFAGNALMAMGQYEPAVKEYETFVKKYSHRKFLLGPVYQRMGYAYLDLGKQGDALKAFEKAEAAEGAGVATLEMARIYEEKGNIQEAQRKYREITEKLPATTWAMEARSKLPPPDISTVPEKKGTGTKTK